MKKFIYFLLMFILLSNLYVRGRLDTQVSNAAVYPKTQREDALYFASLLFPLNDITVYIVDKAIEEGVDPKFALNIFNIENTTLNPTAINGNIKNKKIISKDYGIGQLNSTYLNEFEWFYWTRYNESEKFDKFNYKHNITVSLRLMKILIRELKQESLAAQAYNCGISRVLKNEIPESTKNYLIKFNQNKLKGL